MKKGEKNGNNHLDEDINSDAAWSVQNENDEITFRLAFRNDKSLYLNLNENLIMNNEQLSLMKQLKETVRCNPFGCPGDFGFDRLWKTGGVHENFTQEREFCYRLRELKNVDDFGTWYLREVFFEAAITSPDMFQHYTHFCKQTGFVECGRNTEFDLFIEYVKSIEEKTSEREERK